MALTNDRVNQALLNEQVTESGVGASPLSSTGLPTPSNTPAQPSIPSTHSHTTENSSSGMQLQGSLMVPTSTTGLFMPEDSLASPATSAARPQTVSCRKTKSPNALLLEEAERYGSQGRRRC